MKNPNTSTVLTGMAVLAITLVLGWIDSLTGYELNFFVFYFIPVSLAAWFIGLGGSVIASVTCALVWFGADLVSEHAYSSHVYAVWNTMIRLCSFLAIGWSVQKIHNLLVSERNKNETLHRTLAEVKVLEGLLPICAQCKKIRDAQGCWQYMEVYIEDRSDAQFSHGYCPDCARKAFQEAGLAYRETEP